jgi:uncharacterized membrane protein YeaQ/YmgE (transglycosylase-associated protein family)
MSLESLIVWVIVGGIAGTIADWLVSGGAWLLGLLNVSIGSGLINDIVTAAIGATVLLLGIRFLRRI